MKTQRSKKKTVKDMSPEEATKILTKILTLTGYDFYFSNVDIRIRGKKIKISGLPVKPNKNAKK